MLHRSRVHLVRYCAKLKGGAGSLPPRAATKSPGQALRIDPCQARSVAPGKRRRRLDGKKIFTTCLREAGAKKGAGSENPARHIARCARLYLMLSLTR